MSTEDSMFQGVKSKVSLFLGVAFLFFLLFSSVGTVEAQDNPIGNVNGFIYEQDGSTPLEGAIIKFRNVSNGKMYESRKSDSKGFFEVKGIERGMYVYGVMTQSGGYNAEGLLGLKVKNNETATMSIALKPYTKEAAMTMEEFYEDLEVNGESYVGKVIEYDAVKRMAQVLVERGYIQMKDKIRTKGMKTDFKQGVDYLESEGAKAKRVYAGQTASVKMKQRATIDDMVFVMKKKEFLPIFGGAWGALALLAANGLITWGIITFNEECVICTSPYETKKK